MMPWSKPGAHEEELQREESQKVVDKWLCEQDVSERPFKHRAITPAALELFGDAAVAEQQQPPPRCKSSMGGYRRHAHLPDLKPSTSPFSHQVLHQPHYQASTRNGGMLFARQDPSGGGAFELPGRCHSSIDVTRPDPHSLYLHPHLSQPYPQAALPPKPGSSVMAQRSARSFTGGNPYQAWASLSPSERHCASPDPTANPPSLAHTTPRVSSLLHAAAAHRAGGAPVAGAAAPAAATSASRAATPSGRSSPASKMCSSLDRAREILQGYAGHSKERRKRAAGDGSSSVHADDVPAGSRTSLDRPPLHPAAHRPSPVPFSRSTPDPSRLRSSPSLGVRGSAMNSLPSHGPVQGREQHKKDSSSINQDSTAAAQPRFLPVYGSREVEDMETVSEAKGKEACSTLEAIQRDAELELRKLDRQTITNTQDPNRPGSPTLYAWDEQQAFPSEEERQQQACFTQHLEAQARESRGPAWEKPPTLGQHHRLRYPSPLQMRISLEAGMGGSKDGAGHKSAPHCISSRTSLDFGTHAPHNTSSRPSSIDSLEGSWPLGYGPRQGMGKVPSGNSIHAISAAAASVACGESRARLPHGREQGQTRSPSAPQGQSGSSSFKGPSPVKTRATDHTMAHSSRCTSPSSSVDCNHHSAPTATFVHQKHNPGPPSPRQQPTFYSHPGATTPAPTPTPSAPPSKTLKSAPLSPTPQPHHQQPIDTVYGSMLFTPGGGTVVHQFQPEHTFARNFLHSQPGYSSEEDSPSSQMLDSPFSNKATSCSLSHLPPFNPAHVHVVESGASSEQGWLISPQTSPKVKDLQQQASIGSFACISSSTEGPTCKPPSLPPLHPTHGTMHPHPPHPRIPHGTPPHSSGFPRSSSGSCSAAVAPQTSKGTLDSKQKPNPPSEVTQSRAGSDSSQGAGPERDSEGKPGQVSAARGLWSKLGARGGLKNISSKNLAQTFLHHLENNGEDFLVEAARNRARSLTGNEDFSAQSVSTKDCRQAPFEPMLPLSKAASRRFGIQPEGDNPASASEGDDDDDMLTPIERESMTARQQKIWAKTRVTVRQVQIMKANPVAFNEVAAEKAEAEARAAADHARQRFQDLCAMVCDAKATGKFRTAVQRMQVNRPYFIPPLASKRSLVSRAAVSKKGERVWRLEDSIFSGRAKENDARDVFDTRQVLERQFELDWARVSSKVRFRKMVTRQDQGLKDAAELERELDEVHDELQKRYTIIRAAFIYFSSFCGSTGSDTFLSMGLMEFHRMTRHCNIADPKTPGIRPSDIDTMFISTNFEEEGGSNEENDANDDNALVRFELLEIIVRMAIGKFIVPRVLSDVSDSVAHLFDNFIEPNLPVVAKTDTNDFRRDRLYCKEMEMEVVRHWDLLQAMFKLYKAKDRTKHFWVEHWIALLESTNILGGHTGIDKHCAKVVFAFSQSTVVDELRRRQRAVSLTFFDFLEALARLSEVLSPPSPAELHTMAHARQQGASADADGSSADVAGVSSGGEMPAKPTLSVSDYFKQIQNDSTLRAARADRVGLGREMHLSAQQRPLAESFSGLMEMMLSGLQEAWGGIKEVQTAARMQKMAQGISGGIELNT